MPVLADISIAVLLSFIDLTLEIFLPFALGALTASVTFRGLLGYGLQRFWNLLQRCAHGLL